MSNKSILYWKWDESIFTGGRLERGLNDIVTRSDFDLVYISFHHLGRRCDDPELFDAIKRFGEGLAAAGRRLLLDIDVRGEFKSYKERYGDAGTEMRVVYFLRGVLDGNGVCVIERENPERGRTGRGRIKTAPDKICGAWAYSPKGGEGSFDADSLAGIPVDFKPAEEGVTRYRACGGAANAGKSVIIAAAFGRGIPDHFCKFMYEHYEKMLRYHAPLNLGGAANDEWGYDVMLETEPGNLFYSEGFPYSDGMAEKYKALYNRSLDGDLLLFALKESGNAAKSYAAVNDYVSLLRAQMKENNDFFYDKCKQIFGADTFVGVHPTFWGDPYDFGVDIFQNGLDWWEVKRDFAQTDEYVIMPVRLALQHKWGGSVWYNMWYSGNTQQLHTYFEESYTNARFGGRTHYLGYECPNEPGVYNLKHPGALEAVTETERQIAKLGGFQTSHPNSSVLVVFGIESASNWLLSYGEPRVTRGTGTLPKILMLAAALFGRYLCDLIPSSEVSGGSLKIENGKARYGSQEYEAVIFISPECAEACALERLTAYARAGGKLLVAGNCSMLSDGKSAKKEFGELKKSAAVYFKEDFPSTERTVKALRGLNVSANRWQNGCLYQDGTAIFTPDARLPRGNYFEIDEAVGGKRVKATANDFIVIRNGKVVLKG